MNGPTKDAGVERIARLEKLAAEAEQMAEWTDLDACHADTTEAQSDVLRAMAKEHAQTAADLRSILAEREKLRAALSGVKQWDSLYEAIPYALAAEVRSALAPSVASETSTDETRDRREVGR